VYLYRAVDLPVTRSISCSNRSAIWSRPSNSYSSRCGGASVEAKSYQCGWPSCLRGGCCESQVFEEIGKPVSLPVLALHKQHWTKPLRGIRWHDLWKPCKRYRLDLGRRSFGCRIAVAGRAYLFAALNSDAAPRRWQSGYRLEGLKAPAEQGIQDLLARFHLRKDRSAALQQIQFAKEFSHDFPSTTHDGRHAGAESRPEYANLLRAAGLFVCTPLQHTPGTPGAGGYPHLPKHQKSLLSGSFWSSCAPVISPH